TVVATNYKVSNILEDNIPIGKPIANTQVYIMDSDHNLLPIGVVGEICIGGSGLARGYLNDPEKTSSSFISNPFVSGGRVYKTGDLGRWLSDGTLEFIGRVDDQVKIRGYRIELGEIESVLSQDSQIKSCCVLAREDVDGNKRLVGYVVVEGDFDKKGIQERLREKLPDYMVPQIWIALSEMPITSNGKIDKKGLPEPDSTQLSAQEYVGPRNERETQLVSIWQELLGIEKIGVHDDFFELGGHSILAIKLISRVNVVLNTVLNISVLFEYSTISSLLENIASANFSESKILIALEERGNQNSIFFTPPVGGTVGCYRDLVQLIGKDQPVYAFQCSGLDGQASVPESVEEMASMFIEEMQKIKPAGPYRLGGYSFGGRVALEMTLQLRSEGFEVEELLIIDAEFPKLNNDIQEELDHDKMFRDFLYEEVDEIGELFGITLPLSDSVLEGASKEEQISIVCKWIEDSGLAMTENEIRGHLEVVFSNTMYSYVPNIKEKLDTQVVLFRALYVPVKLETEEGTEISIIDNDIAEFDYGWNRYTNKEVLINAIPTTHPKILDQPYVNEISEYLIKKMTTEKTDDMIYSLEE
ncbi:thioesterase domain-containing protein, partial [Flavivirga jejuensis]